MESKKIQEAAQYLLNDLYKEYPTGCDAEEGQKFLAGKEYGDVALAMIMGDEDELKKLLKKYGNS